jgi:hypothetical protein
VRVRDVVTELRAFAANIAYLCHDLAPNPLRLLVRHFRCRGVAQKSACLPNFQYTLNLLPFQP